MGNLSRTILHCVTPTSDKVYVIDVNELSTKAKKPYVVMTTWGKREAPRLSSQIKDEYATSGEAVQVATHLMRAKLKTGYVRAGTSLKIPGLKSLGLDLSKIVENNISTPTQAVKLELEDPTLHVRKIKV